MSKKTEDVLFWLLFFITPFLVSYLLACIHLNGISPLGWSLQMWEIVGALGVGILLTEIGLAGFYWALM